jgi:hypothetical protein
MGSILKSAELSRPWTMTRRVASKMIPPTWNRKPTSWNLTSPKEAMITPTTMMETLARTFMLAGAIPIPQVASRTATGVVALSIWMKATLR